MISSGRISPTISSGKGLRISRGPTAPGRSTSSFSARTNGLRRTYVPHVVSRVALSLADRRVRNWNRALGRLRDTQTAELLQILRRSRDSEFGRIHRFGRIQSYQDFRQAVPVGDYDSFFPGIERMMQGESNVLAPGKVRYFANSSGSSDQGRQKFLPITEAQIRQQKQSASDALLRYLAHHRIGDFFSGFMMGLFPPLVMKKQGPAVITCNPALMFSRVPRLARMLYLPRGPALTEPDYDKKLELLAHTYLDHDIRALTGTTCWFSLLFDKVLEAARQQGRNKDTIREVWPNLRLLIGGGVSAAPYRPVLERSLGDRDFALVDTYNATEGGIFAATDHSDEPGMLMIPDRGVFFEFVPAELMHEADATRVPLWEVEPRRLYAIVVTTLSGLYAYTLGDLVRFPSVHPLRIEFAGRQGGCLSTTQELTTHVEIEQSMHGALNELSLPAPVDFTTGAEVGEGSSSKSRYTLFAEFSDGQAIDETRLAQAFDGALQQRNRVYREHRQENAAILPARFVRLPRGSVRRFLRDHRQNNVQAKFPRIVSDAERTTLESYARGY